MRLPALLPILLLLAAAAPAARSQAPPPGPGCCGSFIDLFSALPGTHGTPLLLAGGSLAGGGTITLTMGNALESAPAWLVVGISNLSLPIHGGVLVPSPDLVVASVTSPTGSIQVAGTMPFGVPFGTDLYFQWWISDPAGPFDFAASNAVVGNTPDAPVPGNILPQYISGTDCGNEPAVQVTQYDEHTFILRQSMCTDFEGPFMYLLFGQDRVLLLDTGAGGIPIASVVQGLIDQWLLDHGRTSIDLVVAHSHSHGDHTQGDGQFVGQPNTTVVGLSPTAVQTFFGFQDWPNDQVEFSLGARVLDVIAIPGHQAASIAFYDRWTGLLLTGDTFYPGFLFIFGAVGGGQWPIYQASIQRLVDFTETRPVTHILGTHIEMTSTPGVAYPYGTDVQPDEHSLILTRDMLLELNAACQAMGANPQVEVHDDFIIQPSG